ncbi:succinate dehydrogenase iron-sulfur subunit, partial [Azohydromonas aeria]|uniref:succinate dehydrogenase iron-sulfur subunit n=1 Tax=Azohydromonas aeria TaxID=2590212 RepID=UPI001E5EBD88
MTKRTFQIYRYDPDKDARPYMQTLEVELDGSERMLLDALVKLKQVDPSLSFRRSCREGVCGSDAMNINGKNGLACLTNMRSLPGTVVLKPLPGLPVVRDLIVDMTQFFKQYHSIKPYLVNDTPPPDKERLQSPEERDELNGLYECILCASCSTSCPSFWWNPDKFVGPAGLLQAYRFIADSRDQGTAERLDNLEDPYRLFRCHTIMNCVDVCPKGLNPAGAISKIKELMVRRACRPALPTYLPVPPGCPPRGAATFRIDLTMSEEASMSPAELALRDAAREYHRSPSRGKISIAPTKPLSNQRDLSLAYSPGVAYPCLDIER